MGITRIVIADPDALARDSLRNALAAEADMRVVGEAADFAALVALVESRPVDVVLLDLDVTAPGDPLTTINQMHARLPGLPIIVVSAMPESQAGLGVLVAGAAGYLSKAAAAQEAVSAIRKVARGQHYMSPALWRRVVASGAPQHDRLSPREREVLCLIAVGFTVKEIAAQLELSVSTVHTHRARVLQKLRLRSDVELSHYALQNHLVQWRWG